MASLLDIKQRKQFLNATITRWSSNTQESEKLIDLLARFLIRLHVHSKQALSQKKAEEDAKIITKIISTSGLASILTETSVEAIVKNFWGDAPYNLAPLVETVATETCGLRM